MIFKQVLMAIICVFFIIGVVDYFIGNRLGIGREFERAFLMIGRIMLGVVGMICFSPVLAKLLMPLVTPAFSAIGADTAMFASSLLAPDSGGYVMAMDMAADPRVGAWAGTVVASHIGAAITFIIPASSGVVPKVYHREYSLGALSGLVSCPFGCILGGILAGLPFGVIMINLVPVMVLSFVVAIGLYLAPGVFMKGFVLFGRILTAIILIAMTAAAIERLTGFVVIPGMNPIADGFLIGGTVGLTMAGLFCMTIIFSKLLKKQLGGLSRRIGINEISILHCINSLATIFPGFAAYDQMNPRGRVIYSALSISSGCILGAHLGYIGTAVPEMLMPSVVGKLFSGAVSIAIALFFSSRLAKREREPADTSK